MASTVLGSELALKPAATATHRIPRSALRRSITSTGSLLWSTSSSTLRGLERVSQARTGRSRVVALGSRLGSLLEGSSKAGRPDYRQQLETCHEQQSDLQRTQLRLSIHAQCFLDLLGRGGRLLHHAPQLVVAAASDVAEIDLRLDFLRQQRIRGDPGK